MSCLLIEIYLQLNWNKFNFKSTSWFPPEFLKFWKPRKKKEKKTKKNEAKQDHIKVWP